MGFLRDRVYQQKPLTLDALKDSIKLEVNNITKDLCEKVILNVKKRWQQCLDNEGGHIEI
jgi:hypothetical protein